jgi:hypothetical protein
MNGYETWGNLNVLRYEPKAYVSPEERQRLERVAVGRICGCKSCLCCEELKKVSTTREGFTDE